MWRSPVLSLASSSTLAGSFALASSLALGCAPGTPPAAAPPPPLTPIAAPSSASTSPAAGSAPTAPEAAPDPDQKFAELTSCKLESGQMLAPCRIGYRTFGTLDPARTNAVLWPTWFTGTTKSLLDVVPNKLVDTKKFFLILVDALGDGVSSSPSNSATQPRLAFPVFTIGDMVETQRRLVVDILGIPRLHAVGGISMGGMQALAWGAAHPELAPRVVSIVGSPQLTSHDLLLWTTELHALEDATVYAKGEYAGRPPIRAVSELHALALTTPAARAKDPKREDFAPWLVKIDADTSFDWNDWHRQLEAMLAHDVTKAYGGTMEGAAKQMKNVKALFVVADQDHMVSPLPARALAKAMNARLVALDGPCGHLSPGCEGAKVSSAVTSFLAQP